VPSAWRLTKTKYLAAAWDGEGAKRAGGRWNSPGTAVVYVSGSLSLALVEVLVHLSPEILPAFSAIPVAFDESLVTVPARIPDGWRESPPPPATQAIGDLWVAAGTSVVLRVPSVIVPGESNFLLNPGHPDFRRLRIGDAASFPFDARLVRASRARVSDERG
jgi:RES domain-containing protein